MKIIGVHVHGETIIDNGLQVYQDCPLRELTLSNKVSNNASITGFQILKQLDLLWNIMVNT